jgi:hypothetical protein
MLKHLPGGLRFSNQLGANLKYMNIGFANVEDKANHNFLKLVEGAKAVIPEEFNFKGRKYRKPVENSKLYHTLKHMPKGLIQFTNTEMHPYIKHYMRRSFDYKVLVNDDLKQKKLFQNLHDPKLQQSRNLRPHYNALKATVSLDKDHDSTVNQNHKLLKDLSSEDNKSWRRWLYNSCVEALNEGILNVQAKIVLDNVQDEQAKLTRFEEELEVYLNCVKQVQKLDTDFRFSLMVHGAHEEHILNKVEEITSQYQDLIIGFDLPSTAPESTLENETSELATRLSSTKAEGKHVNLTLHNSESKSEIGDNVIDYLLVKCPKIGHSINLIKHSAFFEDMKKKNICVEASIEANPVNHHQSIKFNHDSGHHHHPLVSFLQKAATQPNHLHHHQPHHNTHHHQSHHHHAEEYTTDLKFVTWDFFTAAFSMEFDLYDFKKVCINSITSSDMREDAKQHLKHGWEHRWNKFVKQISDNAV